VIGGVDWALDRIVPDCMLSWSKEKTVDIRSPHASRQWQLVVEPLSGYLALGTELLKNPTLNGEAFNFGPPPNQNHTVKELIEEMGIHWDNIKWNDISQKDDHVHEAGLLKLYCDKALHSLNWEPVLNFQETVKYTVEWYRTYDERKTENMYQFTLQQIENYLTAAEKKGTIMALDPMPGVLLTPLKDVPLEAGDVLHCIKKATQGFSILERLISPRLIKGQSWHGKGTE
jgi:CDP-glucose 4,6-dehydratase